MSEDVGAAAAGPHAHYILLSHPGGSAMLVDCRGGDASLPVVTTEEFEAAAAYEAMRAMLGYEIVYLRLVRYVVDPVTRRVTGLRALDRPRAGWSPPPGFEWLDLDAAERRALAPDELSDAVAGWIGEQRGAPIPALRPAWARSGWFSEVSEWVGDTLSAAGTRLVGPIRQARQWAISSVLTVPTDEGTLYLKAVFDLFHHEPAVTAALADAHAGDVPEVVAIEPDRGWMLMRELRGRQLWSATDVERARSLSLLARIQRHWVGRADDIAALGGPRRTLDVLADDFAAVRDHPLLTALDSGTLARLDAATPRLLAAARELASLGLPDTLVHGDFHLGNVMADGNRVVIFDWSDACVGHPFFDLETAIYAGAEVSPSTFGPYIAEWLDLAPREVLIRAVALARPLGSLHQVVSYVRILEHLEPEDRGPIESGAPDWLSHTLELIESLDAP